MGMLNKHLGLETRMTEGTFDEEALYFSLEVVSLSVAAFLGAFVIYWCISKRYLCSNSCDVITIEQKPFPRSGRRRSIFIASSERRNMHYFPSETSYEKPNGPFFLPPLPSSHSFPSEKSLKTVLKFNITTTTPSVVTAAWGLEGVERNAEVEGVCGGESVGSDVCVEARTPTSPHRRLRAHVSHAHTHTPLPPVCAPPVLFISPDREGKRERPRFSTLPTHTHINTLLHTHTYTCTYTHTCAYTPHISVL
eukprot:GDKI01042812.1.p1 GENE.GDKI01042812.1~~GDKI01042812.1.p1  ORF type:complete len:251 (-),score=38.76 GDKI01042812.1:236-988(-)